MLLFLLKKLKLDYYDVLKQRDKILVKFELLNHLYDHNFQGKIDQYLNANEYHKVAIYGLNEIANHLYWYLKDRNYEIPFCLDIGGGQILNSDVSVIRPDSFIDDIDVIIIVLNKDDFLNLPAMIKSSVHKEFLEDILAG
jgi:hypothetical protein